MAISSSNQARDAMDHRPPTTNHRWIVRQVVGRRWSVVHRLPYAVAALELLAAVAPAGIVAADFALVAAPVPRRAAVPTWQAVAGERVRLHVHRVDDPARGRRRR